MGTNKEPKKRKLTKEEKRESVRLNAVVKEAFQYLLDTSDSVRDAELLLEVLTSEINRIFYDQRLEQPISELEIEINTPSKRDNLRLAKLLGLVQRETVTTGVQMYSNLLDLIKLKAGLEKKKTPLDALDIKLAD